jgi:hypothetical protein
MMTNVDRQHAADIAAFTTYRNTEAALKRQIIQAVPRIPFLASPTFQRYRFYSI